MYDTVINEIAERGSINSIYYSYYYCTLQTRIVSLNARRMHTEKYHSA